jgi:Fe-S cluster assembly protein SufD
MSQPSQLPKEIAPFVERFSRLESLPQPVWLKPLRQGGLARFVELGFPTLRHEDWRFTNLAPLTKLPFKPGLAPVASDLTRADVSGFTFGRLPVTRLVFLDGRFAPALSTGLEAADGVHIRPLSLALVEMPERLAPHLTRLARVEDNALAALNQAWFEDGAFIEVPAGVNLETPVHLLYLSTSTEAGATAQPRNLILAGRDSRLTVVESYVTTNTAATFTNAVTEMIVGDGAVVEHCKFQDESLAAFHLSTLAARIGRAANFITHSFATGARLSRNHLRTELAGEGLEAILNGLYLTKGEQLADHHMIVDHARPHCASHEYFNGILDDKSKGVFHGRILVRQAAQKTDAKQTNKNLLLSDDATADTKPQLEIYADDVKCTHGATIGQLNKESIFYLRARGIGEDTARQMLIHAFAGEIIERIRCAPAREELDQLVWDRLEANPHTSRQPRSE